MNTDKLLSEMEYEMNYYWTGSTPHRTWTKAISLVKKHCEGEECDHDFPTRDGKCVGCNQPAEEPKKGCESCGVTYAAGFCHREHPTPLYACWQPKPTAEAFKDTLHKFIPDAVPEKSLANL